MRLTTMACKGLPYFHSPQYTNYGNGTQTCSNFLTVRERNIPKSTLSQDFKALREAGLIRSERRGVEMLSTSRCSDIEARFPGLMAAIINAHKLQTGGLRKAPSATRRCRTASR